MASWDVPPFAFLSSAGSELPLALLLVFGSAKLLGEIFHRFGMPAIVGEILAGVLIGPGALGWVKPGEFLSTMSDLGVMFLLFRVGLEVKASELFAVGKNAMLVAVIGVVTPFLAGWAMFALLGYTRIQSMFVGAALVATSVGITAQVLASRGLLRHVASRTILAAAVIDDVLGLIVLAIVGSMAKGEVNVLDLGLTAGLAIGFTMLIATWGHRLIAKVLPVLEGRLAAQESRFNLALVLLFGLSLLATYAGVAAIIGAFLAGMALAESVGHREHDLVHGIAEMLVPFFLAGIGLHFDVAALWQPEVLGVAVGLSFVAVATKMLAGIGAWKLGRANIMRIGVGMIPRGEVGMVVAQLGLGLGVVSGHTYSIVVFMAVVTTVVAPPLLKLAYRGLEGKPEEDFSIC